MTNRYFNIIVLSAFITAGIFACKKNEPETPPSKVCKTAPTGEIFQEIPNLDFEDWYSGKSAGLNAETYYNPLPKNFWATPNNGSGDLGVAKIPVVVFRVSGDSAHSGQYAAMLKTAQGELFGKSKLIAATIASGTFEINVNDAFNSLRFGKPFVKRPKTVTGYYKYYPVAGDSASAYCYVTKIDANCIIDTIGFGRKIFYAQQEEYAKFEFDVAYKNSDIPQNVVIYFSSSEAGDKFEGQPGNTLFIDDVSVSY